MIPTAAVPPSAGKLHRYCEVCGKLYDEPVAGHLVRFCPQDKSPISEVAEDQLIDGTYLLQRPIGSGGMGDVYEARQLKLGRQVAIKLMKPERLGDRELLKRFQSEARTAAGIDHDNVVKIIASGWHSDRRLYIVMELLKGQVLAERLRQRQRLPTSEAVPLWLQMVKGAAAAHAKGVVHRDLKPDNIFLQAREDGSERVKIIDFGIARQDTTASRRSSHHVVGTLQYMAPEQIVGRRAEATADVYALGLILVEMLSGRLPWTNEARDQFWIDLPPFSRLCPELAMPRAAMDGLFRRVFAVKPEERLTDAVVLLREMDELLQRHPLPWRDSSLRRLGRRLRWALPRPPADAQPHPQDALDAPRTERHGAGGDLIPTLPPAPPSSGLTPGPHTAPLAPVPVLVKGRGLHRRLFAVGVAVLLLSAGYQQCQSPNGSTPDRLTPGADSPPKQLPSVGIPARPPVEATALSADLAPVAKSEVDGASLPKKPTTNKDKGHPAREPANLAPELKPESALRLTAAEADPIAKPDLAPVEEPPRVSPEASAQEETREATDQALIKMTLRTFPAHADYTIADCDPTWGACTGTTPSSQLRCPADKRIRVTFTKKGYQVAQQSLPCHPAPPVINLEEDGP